MVFNGTSALLGAAGSVTATAVSGWISPVLLCASALLMGRSFYRIYVRGVKTRATVVIAWCGLIFVISFWTWKLMSQAG